MRMFTIYHKTKNDMSRQEDFERMAKEVTGDKPELISGIANSVFLQAAEHGYQYAIDKVCEWLQENWYVLRTFRDPRVNKYEIFIRMLRGAMEE